MENNKFNRRDFLIKGAKTIAVGALALSSFDILKLIAASKDTTYEESTSKRVINISDFPSLANVGGYAMITEKVIIIHKSSSKFIALNISCTHKNCDVEYNGDGFDCPCHGSTFDKNGKVIEGPATKNLKSYKVTYDSSDETLTINL
jgi:cytochrome b6-f complex iron-sulfur subunit